MGSLLSRLLPSIFARESQILILGLPCSGKTTLLYWLHRGQVVPTEPTVGFNVETVNYNNIKFQISDFGGHISNRTLWKCFYSNVPTMIYVIDSTDTEFIAIAKTDLHATLEDERLTDTTVLIFANKQDLPGALDDDAVAEALELHKIKNRQCPIFKTCAVNGEGLHQGLDWLCSTMKY